MSTWELNGRLDYGYGYGYDYDYGYGYADADVGDGGDDSQDGRFVEEFFASEDARSVPFDDHHIRLVEAVLRFCRRHRYDPLILTPTAVEVLMLHWVPRQLGTDGHYLVKLPAVLGSFISYGHRRAGVASADTIAALTAVTATTVAYSEMLEAWRFQRSADRYGSFGQPYRRYSPDQHPLKVLSDEVGGLRRLEDLDTVSLPDEPFDVDALPDDIRARVERVRCLAEECCVALLGGEGAGLEYRTALRRLLRDVACGDPSLFRRQSKDETAAASLCVLVGKANDAPELKARLVQHHFTLPGSPSSREQSMRRAAKLPEHRDDLGSTRYLTSRARGRLIERRDRLRAGGFG